MQMHPRPHVVAELPQFLRDADSARLSEDERTAIIDVISRDPLKGDEIRRSGGVRKVRFAGRGKGKSGGYRVVTAYFGPDVPVYLVAMLSKGERGNFSAAEIVGFKKMTTDIARYWQRRKK
jgi:hypothetical protein